MNMTFNISVVIPCYNAGHFLRDAVRSVLAQRGAFNLVEVLVVDDRTDDEQTLEVLEEIKELGKIVVLGNAAPRGPGGARNTGVQKASGDWIAFLDADDVLTEGSLDARCQALRAYPQCKWVGGDFVYTDAAGVPEKDSFFTSRTTTARLLAKAFETNQPQLLETPVSEFLEAGLTNTCASLIATELFRSVGGFDSTLLMQQDYHLFLRLARVADFVFVPKVVMRYRLHENSLTDAGTDVFEWRVTALRRLARREEFEPYRRMISAKIAGVCLRIAYGEREAGNWWPAISAAARSVLYRPACCKAWRCLAAAILGR